MRGERLFCNEYYAPFLRDSTRLCGRRHRRHENSFNLSAIADYGVNQRKLGQCEAGAVGAGTAASSPLRQEHCGIAIMFNTLANHRSLAIMLRSLIFPIVLCTAFLPQGLQAQTAAGHDCMIEARQLIEIRSPVEAMIETVRVKRGDNVAKGQVLATLQSGPERAAVELAKWRTEMQGEIKAAETRVDISQKKLRRAQELHKQKFISANALDEAEADNRLANEELRRARENQRLAELEAQRASEVLSLRTIRSPFSGVVVEVMLKPGEFGAITFKDPIMKLAEIDPLNVEVLLPVTMYGKVRLGQRATVTPEEPVGGRYQTTVKVIDRVVDAASGTFGVRLELPNPKHTLPAGVRCRVQFD